MNVGVTSQVCEIWIEVPGRIADAGDRRQLRSDKRAERIDQNVLVVDVTTIHAVFVIETVVEPEDVLAIIQRVRLLEGDVVGNRTV